MNYSIRLLMNDWIIYIHIYNPLEVAWIWNIKRDKELSDVIIIIIINNMQSDQFDQKY